MTQMVAIAEFVLERLENIQEKGENACFLHFLLFL